MTASQSPQQLFSPSTAPSLVLASMSQAWSNCSRKVVGATASLLLSPFAPVMTATSGTTGSRGYGCCPSTSQRTAAQGPRPTVGKLWVLMVAG